MCIHTFCTTKVLHLQSHGKSGCEPNLVWMRLCARVKINKFVDNKGSAVEITYSRAFWTTRLFLMQKREECDVQTASRTERTVQYC